MSILNEETQKFDQLKSLEILSSPIIFIPAIGTFLIGIYFNVIGNTLSFFAYKSDKDIEIEKYKNIANTALQDAENAISHKQKKLRKIESQLEQREKDIVVLELTINVESNKSIKRAKELDEKDSTLNSHQNDLINAYNEFKEKNSHSNESFKRLLRQKEKHIALIKKLKTENNELKGLR